MIPQKLAAFLRTMIESEWEYEDGTSMVNDIQTLLASEMQVEPGYKIKHQVEIFLTKEQIDTLEPIIKELYNGTPPFGVSIGQLWSWNSDYGKAYFGWLEPEVAAQIITIINPNDPHNFGLLINNPD